VYVASILHLEDENNHPTLKTKYYRMERKGRDRLKEITVRVQDNDLEKAMRILKKKIQNDGLFKRLKLKKSYEKPSEYRRRKQREALRRQRIAAARRNRYR
jgi:small subunit ribosomal protein S21